MAFYRLLMLEAVTLSGCREPVHILHYYFSSTSDILDVHNGSVNKVTS